jgi:hypothetical protein
MSGCDSKPQTVRRAVVAGQWYPGSEAALNRALDGYFARAAEQPLLPGHIWGLISPHAGYAYSGQAAAYAYRQLEGRSYSRVVLMAPSHRAWVGDYAISSEEAYETPLGQVLLDQEFIATLEQHLRVMRIRRDAEHALEIQLPFLQRQLGTFRLVPILMSADAPAAADRLAAALAEIVSGPQQQPGQTLLVASSDLHHIDDYEQVKRRDQRVVEAVDRFDVARLTEVLMDPGSTVCGRMPILTTLHAARRLGATQARVLYHTSSGDVTGERWPGQYTVGYMSAAVFSL